MKKILFTFFHRKIYIRLILFTILIMKVALFDAMAGHISDYQIDYTKWTDKFICDGIAIPPVRFLHMPDTDFDVEEKSNGDILKICKDETVLGCLWTEKRYQAVHSHYGIPCVVHGVTKVCRKDRVETGELLSQKSVIYIPFVGGMFHGGTITADMQRAILIHEIGHANGWTAAHER